MQEGEGHVAEGQVAEETVCEISSLPQTLLSKSI